MSSPDRVLSGQAWVVTRLGEDGDVPRLCVSYPLGGAHCLNVRLHPRDRVEWMEAGRQAARGMKDRKAEGKLLNLIGYAHNDMGKAKQAVSFCRQALQIARELNDSEEEGIALGNLGRACHEAALRLPMGNHP